MERLIPYVPYLAGTALVSGVVLVLLASATVRRFAHQTVAAVYRAALVTAAEYGDEALEWLRSPAGIRYRKALAERAYDVLPATVGPVPVGVVKLWLSRERWCVLVETAFNAVVSLADDIREPSTIAQ
jgi:acyl-CoA synthetase (AMP-forming)/AMP-acid ligase II